MSQMLMLDTIIISRITKVKDGLLLIDSANSLNPTSAVPGP